MNTQIQNIIQQAIDETLVNVANHLSKQKGLFKRKLTKEDILSIIKEQNENTLLEQIFIKFKLSDLEKTIFSQYVEYMNEESKISFLDKVLKNKRSYLDQFIDTELEDFGQDKFGALDQNERRTHPDMYNLVLNNEHENILLLYKGVIKKLSELERKDRRKVYETKFGVNLEKFDSTDIIGKRTMFYKKYMKFITKLSQPKLEKFIDDIFDKKMPIANIF